jgi:hypothetical protein
VSGFGWQDAIAAVAAVVAFAYLVRREVRARRPRQTDGPLVTLGRAPRKQL